MVVDIGFLGQRRVINPTPRPRTTPALSSDTKRLHERLSDITQRANKYKIDLDNAMDALNAANLEIDRLNAEATRLNAKICQLMQELDKATQKKPRGKKGAQAESTANS